MQNIVQTNLVMRMTRKMKELRELSEDDLKKKVYDAKLELSKELGASEIGTVKNPGRIRSLRHDIARILTIQNERSKAVKDAKERR